MEYGKDCLALRRCASKRVLLATVSSAALALSSPATMAADFPPLAPIVVEPAPVVAGPWTFWVEGGSQTVTGGDSGVFGFNPAFIANKKKSGWNEAQGFDYRFDPAWHVSAALRYGQNKGWRTTGSRSALFPVPAVPLLVPTGCTPSTCATVIPPPANKGSIGGVAAFHDETNWVADFMVGRDIGIGNANAQIKAGVRVAEIVARTQGSVSWRVPTSTAATTPVVVHSRFFDQKSRFRGAGPRFALEGSAPISGAWFLDYMAGVAGLRATRSLDQTVNIGDIGGPPQVCLAGCPTALSTGSNGWVLNADVMVGVGYAFTPYAKLSVNYHGDGYYNALRIVDTNNNLGYANRIYHGVNLRLTLQ